MKTYSFAALITAALALGSVAMTVLPAQAYPPHHRHHHVMVVRHRRHHVAVVVHHMMHHH